MNVIKVDLEDPRLPAIVNSVVRIREAVETIESLPLEHRSAVYGYLKEALAAAFDKTETEALEAAKAVDAAPVGKIGR